MEKFERKSDAKRRLTEFQHQKNNDDYVVPKEDTLGEWLDYWLENVVKAKNEITTYESYKNIISYIKKDMGEIPLQKLTAKRCQQYYNDKMNGVTERKLSSNTVKKHHTLLKTVLKLAVRQDMLLKPAVYPWSVLWRQLPSSCMCYAFFAALTVLILGLPLSVAVCAEVSKKSFAGTVVPYQFPFLQMGLFLLVLFGMEAILSVWMVRRQKKQSLIDQMRAME